MGERKRERRARCQRKSGSVDLHRKLTLLLTKNGRGSLLLGGLGLRRRGSGCLCLGLNGCTSVSHGESGHEGVVGASRGARRSVEVAARVP